MNKILLITALACLVCSAFAGRIFANGVEEITKDPEALFNEFIVKYNKNYNHIDRSIRFENFKAFITRVNEYNAASSDATFGITKFADMSQEEFDTTILMRNPIVVPETKKTQTQGYRNPSNPDFIDWREKGAVTAVKDQEQCGSCWAFSATETIESAWILAGKATNTSVDLAPQQIVDCDTKDDGCNGGNTDTAYEYVIAAGGQESESDYPYTGADGTCSFDKSDVAATISSWSDATTDKDETTLENNLVQYGPISVCVDASKWSAYTGGVLTHFQCAFINILDHCVQLVGYNNTASSPFWIVRNSWNTDWGIDGYIYLTKGYDTCGIAKEATYVTI